MKAAAIAVVLVALPATAGATYSIVASDRASSQIGGAGTSCVGTLSVTIIYGSAAGKGAVHAQARVNTDGRDEAARLLGLDTAPADIIAQITDPGFDPGASDRQYGVVDLAGRAAGFTGSTNGSVAADRQGSDGSFTYSIQGNILTSEAVLAQAEAAFAGGCDLADRLMLALEAGAANGEGDSRCTGDGIPSDSGFIRVEDAGGTLILDLDVVNTSPASPLVALRQQYDAWRADNPCPLVIEDAGPQPADAGAGPVDPEPADSGCGCRAGSGGGWPFVVLVALFAALSPRRPAPGAPRAPASRSPRPRRRRW